MDEELPDDLLDDSLDDDAFADLPPDTLEDLERKAFIATQNPSAITQARTSVVQVPEQQPNAQRDSAASSDYGFDDDPGVIDLDAQPAFGTAPVVQPAARQLDEVGQREQWRQQRYGAQAQPRPGLPSAGRSTAAFNPPFRPHRPVSSISRPLPQTPAASQKPAELVENGGPDTDSDTDAADVDALQARLRKLEQERLQLQKEAATAKEFAQLKAGEIAIVRSNSEKTAKDYERRLAELHQQQADQAAKYSAEIEAAKKQRERIETDKIFLEHEAQQANRARRKPANKAPVREAYKNHKPGSRGGSPANTPTKNRNKALTFRDGFEDDSFTNFSPSKNKAHERVRQQPGTPTKTGSKRKRLASERPPSPSPQGLPLDEPNVLGDDEEETQEFSSFPKIEQPALASASSSDSKDVLQAVQTLLSHRPNFEQPRSIEKLGRYELPSNPGTTLSDSLYNVVARHRDDEGLHKLHIGLAETILSLWSACLSEKQYTPLYDLTELLRYILITAETTLVAAIVPQIPKLCQTTIDLIALPTAKHYQNPESNKLPSDAVKQAVQPLWYLQLLCDVAFACTLPENDGLLQRFWESMEFDFVLLMLHRAQPLHEIEIMLQILSTSILLETFGAVLVLETADVQQRQTKNESDIVDRLTLLLFETFEDIDLTDDSSDNALSVYPPLSRRPSLNILSLRQTVLSIFTSLSQDTHGGHLLATHRLFIGRLVRFLYATINVLYHFRSEEHQFAVASLVNGSVLILHHLVTEYTSEVGDIKDKLKIVPGGQQKYLVSLSRIAFAEGATILESGISGEAAECAHAMLDVMLSPEEGEGVVRVLGSLRSSVE